jgi:hypothetical protein
MSATYPLSFRRRVGRQWAARLNSLRHFCGKIVEGTERAVQRAFGSGGSLIPIPVRTAAGRRRDQRRSHD